MRKFSKVSLLLAPLLLGTAAGCASPLSWMSRPDKNFTSAEARARRLRSVAEQYERDGQPQMAYVIYERVLAQNPQDQEARHRLDMLAQRGIEGVPAKGRPNLQPGSALPSDAPAIGSPAALAKTRTPPAMPEKRGAEQPQQALAKAGKSAKPAATQKPAVPAETTTTPAVETLAKSEKPTATPAKAAPETPAARPAQPAVAQADHDQAEWKSATSDKSVAAAADLPVKGDAVQTDDVWKTTITPASAQTPSVAAKGTVLREDPTVIEDNWTPTRLSNLCEEIPPHLQAAVAKLESTDPQERIAGLLELGDQGEAARGASLAVHALMTDENPLVAVNAAGVLRDISGDAWESVKTLAAQLGNKDDEVVRLSAYLLGRMGPEAMEASDELVTLRNGGQGITSLHAAEALIRITPDDPESVAVLTGALQDKSEDTRWFAAVSLGTVTGVWQADAAKALVKALHDEKADVRAAAALSLGGLGKNGELALQDLERCAAHDTLEVRDAASTALACLRE
ncbi:HEAT repeat domain-containing protein [Planctomicrobium sp. SH664]|uniref:HEAT repeat domain-containing protein n=1 Tax=Planctomicrobium sp. SH664 TaxID=3448125 RepID=UPI003F5B343F